MKALLKAIGEERELMSKDGFDNCTEQVEDIIQGKDNFKEENKEKIKEEIKEEVKEEMNEEIPIFLNEDVFDFIQIDDYYNENIRNRSNEDGGINDYSQNSSIGDEDKTKEDFYQEQTEAENLKNINISNLFQIIHRHETFGIGAYSPNTRKQKIQRFKEKKSRRNWTKRITHEGRKKLSESRLRVKGRFVKKEEEENLRHDHTLPSYGDNTTITTTNITSSTSTEHILLGDIQYTPSSSQEQPDTSSAAIAFQQQQQLKSWLIDM